MQRIYKKQKHGFKPFIVALTYISTLSKLSFSIV